MNRYRLGWAVGALLLAVLPAQAAPSYSIKTSESDPPMELAPAIRSLIGNQCTQVVSGAGQVLVEVWFRKEVSVKATAAQFKNGLTYREVPVSTIVGAVRVPKGLNDYRKQTIKPGVYTLRMGVQPMDGDHMGTAPYSEFCLVCPAADDRKAETMEVKHLNELSGRSTGSHPGVLLLFPGKGATAEPNLLNKGSGHWVLYKQINAVSADAKGPLLLGLVVVGTSPAA